MSDPYTIYETGMQRLLDHLGQAHPRAAEAATYQQRLLENIALTRQHGDTEQRRADRAAIIAQINALAHATGGPVMEPVASAPGAAGPPQGAGEQRTINTGGGDYAEGTIDQRQGAFVEGQARVTGPVVGNNTGQVNTNYHFHEPPPSPSAPPPFCLPKDQQFHRAAQGSAVPPLI